MKVFILAAAAAALLTLAVPASAQSDGKGCDA
jgi:hypothetical protein